jgi:DNA-directed RNA polymerase specialized sigma24 family protein
MRITDMTEPDTGNRSPDVPESIRNETAIIERARQDPAAFAPLYREYVGPVYRFCYRRLGTKELAEDATSQTFTKALRGLHGFENRSFRSWLFSITYRIVIDIYRKQRPDTTLENITGPSDPDPTPEVLTLNIRQAVVGQDFFLVYGRGGAHVAHIDWIEVAAE